eukprot:4584942-Ditylum_brightwellii.AAC.1
MERIAPSMARAIMLGVVITIPTRGKEENQNISSYNGANYGGYGSNESNQLQKSFYRESLRGVLQEDHYRHQQQALPPGNG